MKIDYKQKYQNAGTDELVAIATIDSHMYEPEALAAAKEELKTRGMEPESDLVKQKVAQELESREAFNSEPLEGKNKAMFFLAGTISSILSLIPLFIYLKVLKRTRGERKTRESIKWALLGAGLQLCFWICFIYLTYFHSTSVMD